MTKGDVFFGTPQPVTFSVVEAVIDARFLSNSIPLTLPPGASVGVGITLQNSGNTYWLPGQDTLIGSSSPCVFFTGGPAEIRDDDIAAPNTQYQFLMQVTAPPSPGTCDLTLQMSELGLPFGPTLHLTITAEVPPNAAEGWELYE